MAEQKLFDDGKGNALYTDKADSKKPIGDDLIVKDNKSDIQKIIEKAKELKWI